MKITTDGQPIKDTLINIQFFRIASMVMGIVFLFFALLFISPYNREVFAINLVSSILCFAAYLISFKAVIPLVIFKNFHPFVIFFNSALVYNIDISISNTQLYWLTFSPLIGMITGNISVAVVWTSISIIYLILLGFQMNISNIVGLYEMHKGITWLEIFDLITYLICFLFFTIFIYTLQRNAYNVLKQSNKNLEATKVELLMAQKFKNDFFAKISHEIRTPLIAIKGITELLQKKPNQLETDKYYHSLLFSSNHLLNIVNDILDVSKIAENKLELDFSDVELKEIILSTYHSLNNLAEAKGLKYQLTFSDDFPSSANTDGKRLAQILYNLIQNAIKFTPEGYVMITCELVDNFISIKVKDSGIGISKDFAQKIFDDFSQERRLQSEKLYGTGLGLSISEKLCKLLSGELTWESEVNKGSVFNMRLPYVPNRAPMIKKRIESYVDAINFNLNFIIADDNEMNLYVTERILANEFKNSKFSLAYDGKQVLDLLKDQHFDFLFLDLQMPILDGYETARIIREKDGALVIFALTASINDAVYQRCKQLGINEIVVKPFEVNDLKNLMSKYL